MSTQNINAFATRIRNILEKYNLPTIITSMESGSAYVAAFAVLSGNP
jgi:hypothetical protein